MLSHTATSRSPCTYSPSQSDSWARVEASDVVDEEPGGFPPPPPLSPAGYDPVRNERALLQGLVLVRYSPRPVGILGGASGGCGCSCGGWWVVRKGVVVAVLAVAVLMRRRACLHQGAAKLLPQPISSPPFPSAGADHQPG